MARNRQQQSQTRRLGSPSLTALLLVWHYGIAHSALGFFSEKVGFTVKFKDLTSSYRVNGVFVLPNETLPLEVLPTKTQHTYVLSTSSGKVTQIATNRWRWQAPPQAGRSQVTIRHPSSADSMMLNVFVMIPYSRLHRQQLNGYRIGLYPLKPLKRLPIYQPPRGFIEVTPENQDTLVAPHFTLKQFLCKQEGNYPKYMVLQEQLLFKLELILEKINHKGYRCNSLSIMSGYRTPHYNQSIGNVQYSRHVWGGAADIFIDENPKDGRMDDLNRDGKIDDQDTALLYHLIDELHEHSFYRGLRGGLARYQATAFHGPFIHVDVRGFRARW